MRLEILEQGVLKEMKMEVQIKVMWMTQIFCLIVN